MTMGYLSAFIIFGITLPFISSYVLVQVQKESDNQSKMDAFIHKQLPAGKFDKMAGKMERHKHIMEKDKHVKTRSEANPDDLLSTIIKAVSDFLTQPDTEIKKPTNFHIKPAKIQFRSNNPSIMYEVNSESVIKLMKDLLYSKNLLKYLDNLSRKAAIVYRSVKDDFEDGRQ